MCWVDHRINRDGEVSGWLWRGEWMARRSFFCTSHDIIVLIILAGCPRAGTYQYPYSVVSTDRRPREPRMPGLLRSDLLSHVLPRTTSSA